MLGNTAVAMRQRVLSACGHATQMIPGGLVLSIWRSIPVIPLAQSNVNTLLPCRIRSRDEDNNDILKTKDADDRRSGCGRMVCRKCCFEHPQRSEFIVPYHTLWAHIQDLVSGAIACLDCSTKQPAPQTEESNALTHGAWNPDHSLTCNLMATC
jgi:hypothetical protein